MLIIGCDYHPGFQQIAYVDTETGEFQERRLQHPEEAEKFYRALWEPSVKVRVGMEASGHARWFERLLEELSEEIARASRSNRCFASGFDDRCSGKTLIATMRSSRVSRAR